MTEKITSVSSMPKKVKKTTSRSEAEQAAVRELVKAARARGEDLTGPDGLLKSITATVLETALEEELTERLGHEKYQAPTAESGNIRNGTRPKTVLTDAAGEVSIAVPRDRAGTFEPVIVNGQLEVPGFGQVEVPTLCGLIRGWAVHLLGVRVLGACGRTGRW